MKLETRVEMRRKHGQGPGAEESGKKGEEKKKLRKGLVFEPALTVEHVHGHAGAGQAAHLAGVVARVLLLRVAQRQRGHHPAVQRAGVGAARSRRGQFSGQLQLHTHMHAHAHSFNQYSIDDPTV